MKSYKHECLSTIQIEKKWSFLCFRVLRRCLDICMIIFALTDFYTAILSPGNKGMSGSGVGPTTALPSPPWTPKLVCPSHEGLEASSPEKVGVPRKESALQGLKSGLSTLKAELIPLKPLVYCINPS